MTPFEFQNTLDSMVLLVDTREQDTQQLRKRLKDTGLRYKRKKLDFGDYSCEVTLPDGSLFDCSRMYCIERKMSIDELALCFSRDRKRFAAEFDRAKDAGAKIYLLVENGTTEKIINGQYRSKMTPNALLASLFAFLARYNCQVIFCKSESTGRIIREIVYREAKELLKYFFTIDFSEKKC